jgi:hypothetical protein
MPAACRMIQLLTNGFVCPNDEVAGLFGLCLLSLFDGIAQDSLLFKIAEHLLTLPLSSIYKGIVGRIFINFSSF